MTMTFNHLAAPAARASALPKRAVLLGVLAVTVAWPQLAVSQDSESAKVPDFSVGWARIRDAVETFEPVAGAAAGPSVIDPKFPRVQGGVGDELRWVADLSNPILKPET